MKKIKELQERKKLSEGRSYGIGFSILKKDKKEYQTYLPFTACRDYLNDFSYVEHTKKEIGSIHGYNHKLLNCFNNERTFYLGVNTLDFNNGGNWTLKNEAEKILINNYKTLELFINTIENKINLFKTRTKIELDENTLIIKSPSYWNKTTSLISVYTLLIRCFFNIEFKENEDILIKMKEHKCFINNDSMMKNNCIRFYELNTKNFKKISKIDYSKFKIEGASAVHNFGINGYLNRIKNDKQTTI